jgi:hypothetical protein
MPTELPWWVWPPAALIIGLAVAVAWLNQKGYWVTGRELKSQLDGRDQTIVLLKGELDKANGRWQDERDQRIEDNRAMSALTIAARTARGTMQEVAEDLDRDDIHPYSNRLTPKRRPTRRSPASGG